MAVYAYRQLRERGFQRVAQRADRTGLAVPVTELRHHNERVVGARDASSFERGAIERGSLFNPKGPERQLRTTYVQVPSLP